MDFDDCRSVPVFTRIIAHAVYYDGEHETLGLVRVVTPDKPGGVWVYFHALLHQESQLNAAGKMQQYLLAHNTICAQNYFHPIFAQVEVKSRGRDARDKPSEPAFIVSSDSKDKNGFQVGYIERREQGCQDVLSGQVVFQNILASFNVPGRRSDSVESAAEAAAPTRAVRHLSFTTEAKQAAISSIEQFYSLSAISPSPRSYANYVEPRNYQHSQSYPDAAEWEQATQSELQSFLDMGVIDPCHLKDIPPDVYVVDSRMIYKLKLNKDGTIDKYKARLVCRGFTQVYGENYDSTYAPVSQLVTVRIVIVLCLHFRMIPHHLDVKTAFLNSTLKHEVYVKLPKGVTLAGYLYGKAIKSIYGLKQAAHDWHQLQEAFILGFDSRIRKSEVDPCLYVIVEGDFVALISTHVDDYIVACTDMAWYDSFLKAFSARFEVNDLGVLDHILQMSIEWQPFNKGVSISQRRYIMETAEKYNLDNSKPQQTPMEKSLQLTPALVCDASLPYRNIIGALLWIARASRPDILFAVIYLAKFASCYDGTHFKAAKRVVRYLVATVDDKLTYHQQPTSDLLNIMTYTDSDWAGDHLDRKSFSGSVVFLNDSAVSWHCKKQTTVALSSVEAEYMALSDATRETLYVHNLLAEFFRLKLPIVVDMDNIGAGHIAENDVNNKLTKHIDIRHHFVRYYVKAKIIELFYVPTADNVADVFTKALGPDTFKRLVRIILRLQPK